MASRFVAVALATLAVSCASILGADFDVTGKPVTGAMDASPSSADAGALVMPTASSGCAANEKRCAGACRTTTDPAVGCGTADCSPCAAPPNANATCENGGCGFACFDGFVQADDTCVAFDPNRGFSEQPSGMVLDFHRVWGRGHDVYAVGGLRGDGVIAHSRGDGVWVREDGISSATIIRGIAGSQTTRDIFATGYQLVEDGGLLGAEIYRSDGSGHWSQVYATTNGDVLDDGVVDGAGSRAFAVGFSAEDGGTWGTVTERQADGGWALSLVGSSILHSIDGKDGRFVAVGSAGGIYGTVDGGKTWAAQASIVTTELRSVAVFPDRIIVVGHDGVILRSTGDGRWTREESPVGGILSQVRGLAANDLWIATDGAILHSTGDGHWSKVPTDPSVFFEGIWPSRYGTYAVGRNGKIFFRAQK